MMRVVQKRDIFWNLFTHQLTARGPSPLESLPILYLLSSSCSSNDEFLVHPSVIRVIGRSSRSQKLQVVFLSSFLNLIQSFWISFSASELIMIERFLFVLREVWIVVVERRKKMVSWCWTRFLSSTWFFLSSFSLEMMRGLVLRIMMERFCPQNVGWFCPPNDLAEYVFSMFEIWIVTHCLNRQLHIVFIYWIAFAIVPNVFGIPRLGSWSFWNSCESDCRKVFLLGWEERIPQSFRVGGFLDISSFLRL